VFTRRSPIKLGAFWTAWRGYLMTWASQDGFPNLVALSGVGTTKGFVARVPAVYLTSAEAAVLSFLPFNEINKLHTSNEASEFKSRPGHQFLSELSLSF